jgi:3-methyl-2-oxobutanoate hydroxymethyltransferase
MAEATKKKSAIPSFREKKGNNQKVTMITVYDYPFARLVDRSEAELILVGDSLGMVVQGLERTNPVTLEEIIYHARAVRRGAPNTLIVGDMPFMSYQISPEQALASAGRIVKESEADCVKMEGGEYFAPYVEKIVSAGIPTIGHIGLTPQSASALGGFTVQGRTKEEGEQLIADAKALDAAGAFAIVLECIPSGVAKVITESVEAVTIGCGAGPHVDACRSSSNSTRSWRPKSSPVSTGLRKRFAPEPTRPTSTGLREPRKSKNTFPCDKLTMSHIFCWTQRERRRTAQKRPSGGALSASQHRLPKILQRHRILAIGYGEAPKDVFICKDLFLCLPGGGCLVIGDVNKLLSTGSCGTERAPPDGLRNRS